jgi:hypothetical protein
MNKEDIWVSRIAIPVKEKPKVQANDVFNSINDGKD